MSLNTSELLSFDECTEFLLRPPGLGIHTVSAGKGASDALLNRHFSSVSEGFSEPSAGSDGSIDWTPKWLQSLERLGAARIALLGVPLDTGAGIRRGAAHGPRAIRAELLGRARYCEWLRGGHVVDLGDVFVNPHLLHDEMLSDEQRRACQDEMYARAPAPRRGVFPVAALSQAEAILLSLYKKYPHLKVFVLGGDHSVAWPTVQAFAATHPEILSAKTLGILQPDAHTDLLPHRLGVKICFGTWSYHANELIGRGGRLVQIGIRQSGKTKAHWESTLDVQQYWADEIEATPREEMIDSIIAHFKKVGVKQIYFSNDIDGTDEEWASATGTPAKQGFSPDFLNALVRKCATQFEFIGADLVEVAPDLGSSASIQKTLTTAGDYALETLEALLKG